MKNMSKFFFVVLALCMLSNSAIFAQDADKASQVSEKVAEETGENTPVAEVPVKPKREINTLFGGSCSNMFISGYGAVTASYARIKGNDAYLVGGRGGVILDNFVLGISGAGLTHPDKRSDFGDNSYTDDNDYVHFGYGGGLVEYYFFPKKLVHFSIGTMIGGGALAFTNDNDDDDDDDDHHSGTDKFFVIEPEANVFINITRFCRIGIGGSYRYVKGLDKEYYKDEDFSGANAKIIAAFGWF